MALQRTPAYDRMSVIADIYGKGASMSPRLPLYKFTLYIIRYAMDYPKMLQTALPHHSNSITTLFIQHYNTIQTASPRHSNETLQHIPYSIKGSPTLHSIQRCPIKRHSFSIMLSIFIVALIAASVWSASRALVRNGLSLYTHEMLVCTRASVRPPGGMLTW